MSFLVISETSFLLYCFKLEADYDCDRQMSKVIIIIIMAEMAVFYVAGYLIEERRRWPVITASPRGQCSK